MNLCSKSGVLICLMTLVSYESWVDMIMLDMVNFDVILGKD